MKPFSRSTPCRWKPRFQPNTLLSAEETSLSRTINWRPLKPPGCVLEVPENDRRRFRLAVFVALAIQAAGMVGLLVQGCIHPVQDPHALMDASSLPASIEAGILPAPAATQPIVAVVSSASETPQPPPNPAILASAPALNSRPYRVSKGESLASISRKQGIALSTLRSANPGLRPTRLQVGQTIQIPAT